MVTQAIMDWVVSIVHFLSGLVPSSLAPPAQVAGSAQLLVDLFDNVNSMGVWIPLGLAGLCAVTLVQVYVGGALIKGARVLVSMFIGGGGAS